MLKNPLSDLLFQSDVQKCLCPSCYNLLRKKMNSFCCNFFEWRLELCSCWLTNEREKYLTERMKCHKKLQWISIVHFFWWTRFVNCELSRMKSRTNHLMEKGKSWYFFQLENIKVYLWEKYATELKVSRANFRVTSGRIQFAWEDGFSSLSPWICVP